MLLRSDPFSELNWLTDRLTSVARTGVMPMDVYRQGDEYVVHLDLPGVDESSIDVTVDHGTLSITAQRSWNPDEGARIVSAERPQGSFTRQITLGDALDVERAHADYDKGVLTVRVPLNETATTRKVQVTAGTNNVRQLESNSS
jgi:HSP20 family protein